MMSLTLHSQAHMHLWKEQISWYKWINLVRHKITFQSQNWNLASKALLFSAQRHRYLFLCKWSTLKFSFSRLLIVHSTVSGSGCTNMPQLCQEICDELEWVGLVNFYQFVCGNINRRKRHIYDVWDIPPLAPRFELWGSVFWIFQNCNPKQYILSGWWH